MVVAFHKEIEYHTEKMNGCVRTSPNRIHICWYMVTHRKKTTQEDNTETQHRNTIQKGRQHRNTKQKGRHRKATQKHNTGTQYKKEDNTETQHRKTPQEGNTETQHRNTTPEHKTEKQHRKATQKHNHVLATHQDFKHPVGRDDQGTWWQVTVLLG